MNHQASLTNTNKMNHYDLLAAVDNIIELNERLISVTKQRDAIEAKIRIELRGHPDSELWGDAGLIAATMRCVDALDEVTEQRDEWKAKYIQQNLDLGCELMDPNGTIWDHAEKVQSELTAVTEQRDAWANLWADLSRACVKDTVKLEREAVTLTEQRDRLADALSFVVSCGYDGPLPKYARDKAQEALAAVKGGSNE